MSDDFSLFWISEYLLFSLMTKRSSLFLSEYHDHGVGFWLSLRVHGNLVDFFCAIVDFGFFFGDLEVSWSITSEVSQVILLANELKVNIVEQSGSLLFLLRLCAVQ